MQPMIEQHHAHGGSLSLREKICITTHVSQLLVAKVTSSTIHSNLFATHLPTQQTIVEFTYRDIHSQKYP